jgi:hypothetical protein
MSKQIEPKPTTTILFLVTFAVFVILLRVVFPEVLSH